MNSYSTYAFYGSLRKGMINYHEFEKGLQFQFVTTIKGFQLYKMEHYPYAVRTNNPEDSITVEVFRIIYPEVEKSIYELEIEVGYYYDEVEIERKQIGIYLFKKAGPEPLVKGGDWVKFFGS